MITTFFSAVILISCPNIVHSTFDINLPEFQYLSDHLTPEECRKLVAGAHIKSYEAPSDLDEGESKIPDDIPCLDLLLHWNSARGEGQGESHDFLEHRLRQMDKQGLADWLGKTVFKELNADLNETLSEGFKEYSNDSVTEMEEKLPSLSSDEEIEDPHEWTAMDSLCFAVIVMLSVIITSVCARTFYVKFKGKIKERPRKNKDYERIDNFMDTDIDSEDKFDIRDEIYK